jgi:hypothetical protein
MDIERLPSGKFATNALILACPVPVYNVLRRIGQNGLIGASAPLCYRAKRRRIRTIRQGLMYLAARLIHSGRRIELAFDYSCPVVPIFQRLYARLAGT